VTEFNFAEQVQREEKKFDFSAKLAEEPKEEVGVGIPFMYSKKTLFERLGLPETATGEQIKSALGPSAATKRGLIGFGRGFTERMQGIQQFGLEFKSLLGVAAGMREFGDPTTELDQFNKKALQELIQYQKLPISKSTAAEFGEAAGQTAPFLAVPGTPTGMGMVAAGTGIGALEGVTRFVRPGDDRIGNMITGAKWGLGGGLGFAGIVKLANTLRGTEGLIKQHPEVAELNKMVQKAKDAGLKLEPLMIHQRTPENMIAGRLGSQAESTSKLAQHRLASQQGSVLPALKQAKDVDITRYQAGKVILSEADKAYKGKLENLRNALPRVTARKAGKALKGGIEDFSIKSRKHVSNLYNKVDEAAKIENPVYDLSYAKETSSDIRKLVVADGDISINVASTPEGRLNSLLDDIDKIEQTQTSYDVLKNLRTRAGELIEVWPWDASVNKGQAKRLYRTLSEIINNPVNSAPKTVSAHKSASSAARARFEALDSPSIQKIMKSDNPFKISQEFGEIGGLTDDVMFQMAKWSPQKSKIFKDYVKNNKILMEGDSALGNIKEWQLKDPEGYRFLVPKKEEADLIKLAVKTDELRNSNIGVLVQAQTKAKDSVRTLLGQKGTSQADIDNIINSFGGRGTKGHDALRAGIYEDIIDRTMDEGKFGPTISKAKLNKVINEYETNGAINLLTREDRVKIKGLQSYLRLIMMRGKDPGVSLEAAQAISNLKHPATFISGVHQLGVNSIMARILMSKRLSNVVFGSGAKAWQVPGSTTMKTGAIMDSFLEDYGEQVTEEQQ
jgi:hypothetical protein